MCYLQIVQICTILILARAISEINIEGQNHVHIFRQRKISA